MSNPTGSQDHRVLLIAYWLVVGTPLIWGVTQTISNAMKLFS
jgi:hypothetical protein